MVESQSTDGLKLVGLFIRSYKLILTLSMGDMEVLVDRYQLAPVRLTNDPHSADQDISTSYSKSNDVMPGFYDLVRRSKTSKSRAETCACYLSNKRCLRLCRLGS